MIRVTRESFYATVGQINVHPCIKGGFDPSTGYTEDWETPERRILGRTSGINDKVYSVTPEFFEKNSDALVRVPA